MLLTLAQRSLAVLLLVVCLPSLTGARSSVPHEPVARIAAERDVWPVTTCETVHCGGALIASDTVRPSHDEPTLHAVLDELTREPASRSDGLHIEAVSEAKSIDRASLTALVERCAPATPASVILAIIAVESTSRPLLLSQNSPGRRVFAPHSRSEAMDRLDMLIASSSNVDIGLMQINSATLQRLHVSPREALDPCRNVALGAKIFDAGYAAAFARHRPTPLMMSAYSTYNTGAADRGFANGYVDRVEDRVRASRLYAGG